VTLMGIAAIAVTVIVYATSLCVRRRWQNPATTPVLTTVAALVALLWIGHVPYVLYQTGGGMISAWLGPATAALAVLMFKHRAVLLSHAGVVVGALACGSIASHFCAVSIARILGITAPFTGILALKSVTVAVSSQLAPLAHAPTSLLAIVVIAVGVMGAAIGPAVLTFCAVDDRLSRGLALGCISHGIGTAQAATESETTGAASSLAMCVVALAMCTIGLPLVIVLGR
jgi:putative effector of murein hydrolase